jgi:hypothetical protein
METPKMITLFLGYLYEKNYADDDPTLEVVDLWVKTTDIDRTLFWKSYESMIKLDLIRFVQDEAVVRLTPKGTLCAEKSGLVSNAFIVKNRDARKQLLSAMASCLIGKGSRIDVGDLVKEVRLSKGEVYGNIELLVSMGYAKWEVSGERLSISPRVCAKANVMKQAA